MLTQQDSDSIYSSSLRTTDEHDERPSRMNAKRRPAVCLCIVICLISYFNTCDGAASQRQALTPAAFAARLARVSASDTAAFKTLQLGLHEELPAQIEIIQQVLSPATAVLGPGNVVVHGNQSAAGSDTEVRNLPGRALCVAMIAVIFTQGNLSES